MASDLGQHIEPVARACWGDPNAAMSKPGRELRWGRNGSKSADLKKGVWHDHETDEGGGVLDLLQREMGLNNGAALDWLRNSGLVEIEQRVPSDRKAKADKGKLVATYDYVDETGTIVSQVQRFELSTIDPKTGKARKRFVQRRPDGPGQWAYNLNGVRLVPYRLPDLLDAVGQDLVVFVTEGEKAADVLAMDGAPATTNPMGAGKWPEHFAEYFAGARVVILPDNDTAGREHATKVAANLSPVALEVCVVDLPGLGDKEDFVEWRSRGGTIEQLYDIVARTPRWSPDAPIAYKPKFGPMAWADVFSSTAQRYSWLVKGILPEREAALIYGAPHTGKSFASQDMALSIARGICYFGRRVTRAGVIYCAFEGGRGFRKRQLAYANHHCLTAGDDIPMVVLTKRADLFGDADFDPLCKEIEMMARTLSVPLGLIVFDTWSAATPGANENASEDVSKIRAKIVKIDDRFNCASLVVHHKPAAGGKPRGHSSLTGDFETTIDVDWVEGATDYLGRHVRQASLTKQREGRNDVRWRFALASVPVGVDEDGEPITSCAVDPVDDTSAAATASARKSPRLTDRARIALAVLRDVIADVGEPAPAALRVARGVRVVRWGAWRDRLADRLLDPDEELSPEAKKKALQRVGLELHSKGVIQKDNPYVWIVREPNL